MTDKTLWEDRKRGLFGLPWTFTKYTLTDDVLLETKGVFTVTEEEIRLYRVLDITMKLSLRDRIWGVGTIHLCTADQTAPEFNIKRVKNPREVRALISDLVEKSRESHYITVKEDFHGGKPGHDDEPHGDEGPRK